MSCPETKRNHWEGIGLQERGDCQEGPKTKDRDHNCIALEKGRLLMQYTVQMAFYCFFDSLSSSSSISTGHLQILHPTGGTMGEAVNLYYTSLTRLTSYHVNHPFPASPRNKLIGSGK